MTTFRTVCFALGLLAASSSLALAESNALREYKNRMVFFQRGFGISYVASLCQIRSTEYASVFNEARHRVFEGERAKHRLSPQEWTEAENFLNSVLHSVFVQIKFETNGENSLVLACRYLPGSQELAEADRMWQLISSNLSQIR